MSNDNDMKRRLALMATKYPRRLDMVELRSILIPRPSKIDMDKMAENVERFMAIAAELENRQMLNQPQIPPTCN